MLSDLDCERDLEWLRRLDDGLSSVIECVALDAAEGAQSELLSLEAWIESSDEIRSGQQMLIDVLRSCRANLHIAKPRALTGLIELRRFAHKQVRQLQEEQLEARPVALHTYQQLDGRYWAPTSINGTLRMLLAVENTWGRPMNAHIHHELMAEKVARLFAVAGPEEASRALEVSPENLPELAAIRSNEREKDWPTALMMSDTMMGALNCINWTHESVCALSEDHPSEEDIREELDGQILVELLECL